MIFISIFLLIHFHCFVLWMNSVWHNHRTVGNKMKTTTDRIGKLFSFRQPFTSGHTICTSAILNILNRRWAANSLCWLFTWWLIFSKIEVHWAWNLEEVNYNMRHKGKRKTVSDSYDWEEMLWRPLDRLISQRKRCFSENVSSPVNMTWNQW